MKEWTVEWDAAYEEVMVNGGELGAARELLRTYREEAEKTKAVNRVAAEGQASGEAAERIGHGRLRIGLGEIVALLSHWKAALQGRHPCG